MNIFDCHYIAQTVSRKTSAPWNTPRIFPKGTKLTQLLADHTPSQNTSNAITLIPLNSAAVDKLTVNSSIHKINHMLYSVDTYLINNLIRTKVVLPKQLKLFVVTNSFIQNVRPALEDISNRTGGFAP